MDYIHIHVGFVNYQSGISQIKDILDSRVSAVHPVKMVNPLLHATVLTLSDPKVMLALMA